MEGLPRQHGGRGGANHRRVNTGVFLYKRIMVGGDGFKSKSAILGEGLGSGLVTSSLLDERRVEPAFLWAGGPEPSSLYICSVSHSLCRCVCPGLVGDRRLHIAVVLK